MRILITGTAGFIGFSLARRLLSEGHAVVGIDNLNDYYDVQLKRSRLAILQEFRDYTHYTADISDKDFVGRAFAEHRPETVVNLAAQAGVRYAAVNPHAYIQSNVTGFLNIIEGCRVTLPRHLVFASTSSVYGANRNLPFSEKHSVDHPLSLYAATKRADELMAHSYSALFGIPMTGLRFFTVYGPWGRPDMALFEFTRRMLAGHPIPVFNGGDHARAFTYIDDIVEGVCRVMVSTPLPKPGWNSEPSDPSTSFAPFRLYNIGSSQPVPLMEYIRCIEDILGKKATCEFLPLQPGDIKEAAADTSEFERDFGFCPKTTVHEGIPRFVEWYLSYYQHGKE
jgi:UDP-glucuronate 4-epimerase